MGKALVVGIDYYEHHTPLYGCTADAAALRALFERHGTNEKNLDAELLMSKGSASPVTKSQLIDRTKRLFNGTPDIALFYFLGHSYIDKKGGYLLASDTKEGHCGFSMQALLGIASESMARNKMIILDCCHSGVAGDLQGANEAVLSEGLTILTASENNQYTEESESGGVFTRLFIDALSGGSADIMGAITLGSVYAHIDQSLGPWDQRPVFKTNVKEFVPLRKVVAPITITELHRLVSFFLMPDAVFKLDPSYEPTTNVADPKNTETFSVLQKFNRINLVTPVGAEHMYYAAMNSTGCRLTELGKHYLRLVKKGRI